MLRWTGILANLLDKALVTEVAVVMEKVAVVMEKVALVMELHTQRLACTHLWRAGRMWRNQLSL